MLIKYKKLARMTDWSAGGWALDGHFAQNSGARTPPGSKGRHSD